MSDLFRKEVYQHQARRLSGAVVIVSPPGLALICWIVGVFAVAVVVFLATATYARKELVAGWLVPEGGMIRVEARQVGVVETLLAREGDQVNVGQALATLRISSDLNGGDSYAALSRSLDDQVRSDLARGSVSRDRLEQERGEIVRRQFSLQAELTETRRRLTLQDLRVALAVAEVDRAASIADDEALQWLPMIYQRKIEKDFELRIVVMGRTVFAAKINSQDVESAVLDWRAGQSDPNLLHEEFELPDEIEATIFRFMDAMGLIFGSLDVVVAPDGKYWFLEINEQGQFLFLETLLPKMPLLDAFAQFCANTSPDFVYAPFDETIRLASFYQSEYWKLDHAARMDLHLLNAPLVSEKE